MSIHPSLLNAVEQVCSYIPTEHHILLSAQENPQFFQRALEYWEQLDKWNKIIKLTGAKNIDSFAHRHLADSLFGMICHSHLKKSKLLLDIGAGAGFPSLPLSFLYPDSSWSLVESHQRRCAFLQQVTYKLKLPHVSIQTTRVTGNPIEEGLYNHYDTILFRAVSPEQILPIAHNYLAQNGKIIYWGTQSQKPNTPSELVLKQTFLYQLKDGEPFCLYIFEKKQESPTQESES